MTSKPNTTTQNTNPDGTYRGTVSSIVMNQCRETGIRWVTVTEDGSAVKFHIGTTTQAAHAHAGSTTGLLYDAARDRVFQVPLPEPEPTEEPLDEGRAFNYSEGCRSTEGEETTHRRPSIYSADSETVSEWLNIQARQDARKLPTEALQRVADAVEKLGPGHQDNRVAIIYREELARRTLTPILWSVLGSLRTVAEDAQKAAAALERGDALSAWNSASLAASSLRGAVEVLVDEARAQNGLPPR